MRRSLQRVLCLSLAALCAYTTPPAYADECRGGANGNCLKTNFLIGINQRIRSIDGRWNLTLHSDGNLVIWGPKGGAWNAGSKGADVFVMQEDGNAVAYDYSGPRPTAKFHTSSWGHPGAYIKIQNDGNLVVEDRNGTPLWSRFTGVLPTAQGGDFYLEFRVPGQSRVLYYNYYHNGRGRYCFRGTGIRGTYLGETSSNGNAVGGRHLARNDSYDGPCR